MCLRYIGLLIFSFLVLGFVMPASAQVNTADLAGRATDPKGLAVTGASISVVSLGTGSTREVTTGDAGEFSVRSFRLVRTKFR